MSERLHRRSISLRSMACVESRFSRCRSAIVGIAGQSHRGRVAHQVSHDATIPRFRFQVAGADSPHSAFNVSCTWSSVTSASSRWPPRCAAT
ncbi:Uncharacterised protein [Mycobacteroides abscessus subsp. abscessus]|nr:Uncharacterised protein [Mycobacteroides abscessus subsp. abscessus]